MRLYVREIVEARKAPFLLLLKLSDGTFAITAENTQVGDGFSAGEMDATGKIARYSTYRYVKRAYEEMLEGKS